ncbi:hypothetical protein [Mesorhizobium sp. B2-7-1]|uniref:hypothetical protein n=1 Tax=Mesorhizobium sp. B2-7-1 TaxID=2589909 RepID=UPI00112DA4C3|nr:hypothetical protein [Mesorhizobium sp. B2-7-1]TPJ42889.1 hypothetical protein FJ471_33340 [Mesorhizobium sp. B2-7-1]
MQRPSQSIQAIVVFLLLCLLFLPTPPARADQLADRMTFWRQQAYHCTDPISFPSKHRTPDGNNPSPCEDGDMGLYNGLLCAVGEEEGCDGVLKAQSADGRWWRSPRLIGKTATNAGDQVSFAPDQALGVLAALTAKHIVGPYDSWWTWLDANRPCIVENPFDANKCLLQGWPRYCSDDQDKKGCTFRPVDCANLHVVGKYLGTTKDDICKQVLKDFGIDTDQVRDFLYPTELLALGAAGVNETDYPLHLAAVEIFILQRMGDTSPYVKFGGDVLASRDNNNPFFRYLSEGPTEQVKLLTLLECPSPELPSNRKNQWSWERPSSQMAFRDSMYWDCIFMGRLLGAT